MPDTQHVVVLTTLPADADAAKFAHTLVDPRMAACVNLFPPMESIYRWEDRVQQEPERQVLIKTSRALVEALRTAIRDLHPYDVPEFLVLPIADGDDAYLRWLDQSTRS